MLFSFECGGVESFITERRAHRPRRSSGLSLLELAQDLLVGVRGSGGLTTFLTIGVNSDETAINLSLSLCLSVSLSLSLSLSERWWRYSVCSVVAWA